MAELSAVADPGFGHLLGHVFGYGKAVSMSAYHVGTMSLYVDVFAFYLSLAIFFFCSTYLV